MSSKIFTYRLLDSGDGHLLEEMGGNKIIRPEPTAIWSPSNINNWKSDAICSKTEKGKYSWDTKSSFKSPWLFKYESLIFELRYSHSKNIGIFPEQINNWEWISNILSKVNSTAKVLNLFAYTGGATLVAARMGATVCHVDASKSAVDWARRNSELSNLDKAKIRWIVDDCIKFLKREVNRNSKYDAIILDPPAFGRANGITFKFEDDIKLLLDLCKKVLNPNPLFFLLNCYSLGYSSQVIKNLVSDFFPHQNIESNELLLKEEARQRLFSANIFARFSSII